MHPLMDKRTTGRGSQWREGFELGGRTVGVGGGEARWVVGVMGWGGGAEEWGCIEEGMTEWLNG